MKLLNYLAAAAALSMATSHAVAAANPATSLSVAHAARAGTSVQHAGKLEGAYGPYVAGGVLLAVLVTILVVVKHDDKPRSL